jgi:hypothetical protein
MSRGKGNVTRGRMWHGAGGGGMVAWEEIGQLIVSIRLVWKKACYCAQKTNIPSKGWFFVCSVCHSLRKYMFIQLFAFVLFPRLQINHMSGYDHAFIPGPVHMVHIYVPECIYCVKFLSQFFTGIFSYVRGVLTQLKIDFSDQMCKIMCQCSNYSNFIQSTYGQSYPTKLHQIFAICPYLT